MEFVEKKSVFLVEALKLWRTLGSSFQHPGWMSPGTATCCYPVVHTSWTPSSSCRNSMPILYRGAEGDMVRAKITWTFRDGNDAICCYLLKGNRNKLRYVQSQIGESCHGFQVFANYSWLSSGPPIHIAATELRGITIEQLSSLRLGPHQHTAWQITRQFCFFVFTFACEQRVWKKPEHITSHHITSYHITSHTQSQT